MKKLFYLIPAVGLMMASCANEEPLAGQQAPIVDGYEASSFLSLSLKTGSTGVGAQFKSTRADNDPVPGYVDGSTAENNVKSVRFFFFDNQGNATPVWVNNGTNTTQSYLDWYPTAGDVGSGIPGITVEKTLSTTLGLNVPSNYQNPTNVVAILNPTEDFLLATNYTDTKPGPSLEDLQGVEADYFTGLHDQNFVMSNSAYVDENGDAVYATSIDAGSFKNTLEEAAANPVTIYVERVLARLDFYLAMEKVEGQDYYSVAPATEEEEEEGQDGDTYTVDDQQKQIFVKFLGWNITSTPSQSRLIKSINSEWGADLFGSSDNPWTIFQYHRSFWGMNPETVSYLDGNFGTVQGSPAVSTTPYPANGQSMPANTTSYVPIYLQENVSPFQESSTNLQGTAQPTKVILAAQLVDSDGEPLSLAEWNYKKYTVDGLLNYLANTVLGNYYKKTVTEGSTPVYDKISPDDLTFVTAAQLAAEGANYGVTAPAGDANYYVYLVLKNPTPPEGTTVTWQKGNSSTAPVLTAQQVNQQIMDVVNHVMVWNTGMTYYYFDVKHLGASGSPAYYGIVRNHIYKTTVTSVTGLGTPVYDPDQIIEPEKPKYTESLIQADIRVLQWRIVSQDYELEW